MKKSLVLRVSVLLLAVLMLAGCGKKEPEKKKKKNRAEAVQTEMETLEPAAPVQEEMPQDELERALSDIDLAVLCAGLSEDQWVDSMENPHILMPMQVVCTDYDQDGFQDVLLGRRNHIIFSNGTQRKAEFTFAQSSPTYYTDNDGNIYRFSSMDDGFDIELDGKPAWVEHSYGYYGVWHAGDWEEAYSYSGSITYVEDITADGDTTWTEVENTVGASMHGASCTKAELDAHLAQIGMEEIVAQPSAFTSHRYDVIYRDNLLAELDTYFAENYSGYQMLRQDIDGDGVEETLFFLPNFTDTWYDCVQTSDEYSSIQDAQNWFKSTFSGDHSYTGFVIAKEDGETLSISAYCTTQDIYPYEGMGMKVEHGYLWLDDMSIYLSGRYFDITAENVPGELVSFMSEYGYSDHFFRMVDVSDFEGEEYLCICRKDGSWYVFVIVIINGDPVILYGSGMGENGVYLTEYQGQQCLLNYYQSVYSMGDEIVTNYNYSVERIKAGGGTKILEYAYANYTDKDEDATSVSKFFDKLNRYLIKIIVIRDPFRLTGRMWIDPAEVQQGTPPQEEPQQNEDAPEQKAVMGFVQIEDPASWLHLRVGPGVEYDKVLMDPADPDSFVRQALGSPVTVLETIETEDAENPVWVKIRISYGDREVVGYSSKRYIRLVNE